MDASSRAAGHGGVAVAADNLDLVLLGPVGSGKGTQARLIAAKYGVPHVASGDLLRQHRRAGTDLGRQAQDYMDRGDLVPDDLVISMIVERMRRPDAGHGVLLDGFPRTVAQAEALDEELSGEGRELKLAIHLNVPTAQLLARAAERWTCRDCGATYNLRTNPPERPGVCDACGGELYQREDDQPRVVAGRIEVYVRDTVPVVDYYRRRGILVEVDGTREIRDVAADVQVSIDRVRPANLLE